MRSLTLAGLCVLGLVSCAQSPEGNAAQPDQNENAAALAVTVESLSLTSANTLDDQLIECVHEKQNGITIRQFFVVYEGALKGYSSFQNYARNFCDPGQPDCAMGWLGNKIGTYSRNSNGVVNQLLLDVEALTMERAMTPSQGEVEITQSSCTSSPLPDGIVID